MQEPTRYLSPEDRIALIPVHAVWEITLACDLKCQHCGSRAGKRRPEELSTEECFDLIRQLARMGTREVTLIGGEAYLRKDWLEIIREIRARGMDCTLQSGGLHLNEERIRLAAGAGLQGAGVSIDGLREVHDQLRGVKGSFDAAFRALRLLGEHGLVTSVNTQITSLVIPQLRELMNLFIEAGARNWQIQLTVAMGRAADHPELLLQPYELLEFMPLLAELFQEGVDRGLLIQPGNNIGYFGPYEALWRGSGEESVHWTGCNAGQNSLGIEADGTIKGCPSLPTSPYAGGNIRDLNLSDIWWQTDALGFARSRTSQDLWGFCGSCYYSDVCKAGCTWTTHSLFGRAGNNPYCHHRTLELSRQGLRERIVQVESAPGTPFDHGRYALLLETMDGRPVSSSEDSPPQEKSPGAKAKAPANSIPLRGGALVQITSARKRSAAKPSEKSRPAADTAPPPLTLCRGCNRHVKIGTTVCPHCAGDTAALARAYDKRMREARKAYRNLLKLLQPS
ncbi:MAG TPA: GDL motif peptide-associated radical SAM/SPASM maturase [Pyrinomonadaceae bacterium]|nr:GDL motif peptide-associated radical SAM/SPASM maturase [Pyrinomonadaceae bacterium]